ncbi:hypothetical protein BYT27DRAFT_7196242 [Phlegmacium glaucopus]|nr:hypothetical protein BYT27DRAFT_7196242 [Phlegmacium glaucopus]
MDYVRQSAQTFHAGLTSTDRGDANPPISIVSCARNKSRTLYILGGTFFDVIPVFLL